MVDALLKLIDYCIKLLDQHDKFNQQVFDRIVTPAYQLGEKVFQDYLELFNELRRKAASGEPVEDLIRFLEEGRIKYLAARVRLRAILGRTDLWQQQAERKLVDGLFGLLCGGLSTYEERQLERAGRFMKTRHTLLDLLYRIDELPRNGEAPGIERAVSEMVRYQQEAITEAWKEASEAYASMQEAVATAGKLELKRSKHVPSSVARVPVAPSSFQAAREIVAAIRGMIPNAVYSRRLGTKLENLVAASAPECAQRAREVREILHDLDHSEPNVDVADLVQGLDQLENELDAFERRL